MLAALRHKLRITDPDTFRQRAFWLAAATIAALQLALIWTHDAWLDEWQALQIAVKSADLRQLFHLLSYEGHPALWYLVLRSAAAIAGSLQALQLSASMIALATLFFIFANDNISAINRILLALSEPVLFEFNTISRSATLGVMAIFAIAYFWHSRWFWFWIILLPATDFLFGVLSVIFILLRNGPRFDIRMVPWIIVSLISAWTVWPPSDLQPAIQPQGFVFESVEFLIRLGVTVAPFQIEWGHYSEGFLIFTPFLFYLIHKQFPDDRKSYLACLAFVVAMYVFSILVYPLAIRHLMLATVLFFALVMVSGKVCRTTQIWLTVLAICGLWTAQRNLTVPFTAAPQVGEWIKEHRLEQAAWVTWPQSEAQAVFAPIDVPFERLGTGCKSPMTIWKFEDQSKVTRAWLDRRAALGDFYTLSILPFNGFKPIAVFRRGLDGRNYYIHHFPGAATSTGIPDCIPGLKPLVP